MDTLRDTPTRSPSTDPSRDGPPVPPPPAGGPHRWRAFALLVVGYLMTIVDFTIVNVALPTIGRRLHVGDAELQWVVTAYALTFAGFLLLGGRAADLLGRRRLLMVGLAVFTLGSLGGGLAGSALVLILMRGLQGVGAALMVPAGLSTVTTLFPEGAERNRALGIWGGAGALGGTVGLLAGGLLTTYVGWPVIFLFNVPLGLVVLALIPAAVPESRSPEPARGFDLLGALTITAAVLVAVYALSEAPQIGWSSPRTLSLFGVGAALLAAFALVEHRVAAPILPMRLFRLPSVAGSNVVAFLLGASWLTFVFVGTLFMQQVLRYSALATGAAWMTASVISLACAGLSSRLVTRTSARLVMTFGMTLIGVGIVWTATVPGSGHYWPDLAVPFFVGGVGTAFAFIPISIGALTGVTGSDAGVASGLLSTSQNLGGAIGVAVASSVTASRPHDLAGGLHLAMLVCGGCALVAGPAALAIIGGRRPSEATRDAIVDAVMLIGMGAMVVAPGLVPSALGTAVFALLAAWCLVGPRRPAAMVMSLAMALMYGAGCCLPVPVVAVLVPAIVVATVAEQARHRAPAWRNGCHLAMAAAMAAMLVVAL